MVAIGGFTRIFWLIHLLDDQSSLPNILYVQPANTPLPEWFRYNGIANENDLRGTNHPTRMQNSLFVRGNISPFASFQVFVRNNEKTQNPTTTNDKTLNKTRDHGHKNRLRYPVHLPGMRL